MYILNSSLPKFPLFKKSFPKLCHITFINSTNSQRFDYFFLLFSFCVIIQSFYYLPLFIYPKFWPPAQIFTPFRDLKFVYMFYQLLSLFDQFSNFDQLHLIHIKVFDGSKRSESNKNKDPTQSCKIGGQTLNPMKIYNLGSKIRCQKIGPCLKNGDHNIVYSLFWKKFCHLI